MRAALTWALERKEVEVALRLALCRFWSIRGYYGEGRRWLEAALAMEGRGLPEGDGTGRGGLAGVGPGRLRPGPGCLRRGS